MILTKLCLLFIITISSSSREVKVVIMVSGGLGGLPSPTASPADDLLPSLDPTILDKLGELLINGSIGIGIPINVLDQNRYGINYSTVVCHSQGIIQCDLISDGCEAENTTLITMNMTLSFSWPSVPLGSEVSLNCPCSVLGCNVGRPLPVAIRRCAGSFTDGGQWDPPLNSNCILGYIIMIHFCIIK